MKTIELTRGKVALVDDCDYDWLSQFNWHYAKAYKRQSGYASRRFKGELQAMQNLILSDPVLLVDHIDGDGLNNQRSNLRLATPRQNSHNQGIRSDNRSGYKGVGWHVKSSKWRARLRVDGKQYHLGYFECRHKAAEAYNNAATEAYGDFSCLNKIGSPGETNRPKPYKPPRPEKTSRLQVNNRSGVSGVHYNKGAQKWVVQVVVEGARKQLGYFKTKEKATQHLSSHQAG